MSETTEEIYDAGKAIDELLGGDDGRLLAAMARYRSSILELFGREGIVELIRQSVDEAKTVEYFSRRSRREIDPGRPEVNLRVRDSLAWEAHEAIASKFKQSGVFTPAGLGSGATDDEHAKISAFKASVIFQEVCNPLATKMCDALRPHWAKARAKLIEDGLDESMARMMIYNMFVVRVGQDKAVKSEDKLCTLSLFV